jgi:hypothetical protein
MADQAFVENIRALDQREDQLIAEFAQHPFFLSLPGAWSRGDRTQVRELISRVLLQRRFISLAFTPLYDVVIDGLEDPRCKAMAREILQYEYPPDRTSHREDLVSDLLAMGISKDDVLSASPSPATAHTIASLFSAVRKTTGENGALFQIRLLSVIRFVGEVLVAEEYRLLWPSLEQLGLAEDDRAAYAQRRTKSVFYYPHWRHDARMSRLTDLLEYNDSATSHADDVGTHLVQALEHGPPEGVEHCIQLESAIAGLKRAFYDQFLPLPW